MQLYLRITYVSIDSDPHFTVLIPSDRAGKVVESMKPYQDELKWMIYSGGYTVRHELIDEKTIQYLLFEPAHIHEYSVLDEHPEMYVDTLLNTLKKVSASSEDEALALISSALDAVREDGVRNLF